MGLGPLEWGDLITLVVQVGNASFAVYMLLLLHSSLVNIVRIIPIDDFRCRSITTIPRFRCSLL